jgi:hypothetical protein
VTRTAGVGNNLHPVKFETFSAVALGGIGDIPHQIVSRCFPIKMQRISRDGQRERFRYRQAKLDTDAIRAALRATMFHNRHDIVKTIDDNLAVPPDEVGSRQADLWEVLIAIGEAAGNGWGRWAREAAVALHRDTDEPNRDTGEHLLADIRTVFGDDERLPTSELVDRLIAMPESRWAEWFGKPITDRFVAKRLRPFRIRSKDLWFDGHTRKGYVASDFTDAWNQYLATETT